MAAFNELYRFGSGHWAGTTDKRPLYAKRKRGAPPISRICLGFDQRGEALYHPSDGPMLLVAGSGAGKGVTSLFYNALTLPTSMLLADFKAEFAAVTLAVQAAMGKHAYCINPAGLLGLPNHPVDPLDILSADSTTLIPDAKMIAEMVIPIHAGCKEPYFPEKARLLIDGILVADIEINGKMGLRSLYQIISSIEGDRNLWLAFAEGAYNSRFEHVRRLIGEMIYKQKEAPKEFGAIVGDATRALSFLDDYSFLAGLENPAFSLSALCERPCNVYINIPAEYIGIWSSYLRLVIGVAMLYKQRKPQAPRVVFMLDECGQLGHAEFLLRAMTFGRGCGIVTQAVFQDLGQIARHYGREGVQTFMGSSQVKNIFGVRDLETAEMVSRMLGNQTLEYNAELQQAQAQTKKAEIIRQLMAGADPLAAGVGYRQQALASVNRTKMARPLMTPDEILRMPEHRQILFVSGINCPPIAAYRFPYFKLRELAGRFMPNPLHNERDGYVRVPTRWGLRWRRVITEPVPECVADYPQYQHNGLWSYIEGYRPCLKSQ